MRFSNKIVLVTGASKGIGRATALQFAKEGANIVINYRQSEIEAVLLKSEVEKHGVKSLLVKCDVANENDVANMFSKIEAAFGRIDIVINNAGMVIESPILERTTKQWRRTFNVNLLGVYFCSKNAIKLMIKRGEGTIVNVASTSALYDFCPEIIDYDVSKAGVIALTKNFAKSFGPRIRVNAVAPGWVDTDINQQVDENVLQSKIDCTYIKRMAQPEEIARVILFLSSDESSYITGTILAVDGGHD